MGRPLQTPAVVLVMPFGRTEAWPPPLFNERFPHGPNKDEYDTAQDHGAHSLVAPGPRQRESYVNR